MSHMMSHPSSDSLLKHRSASPARHLCARLSMVILLIMGGAAITLLPACNTVNGLGKDIEKGGQKLQEASGSPEANKQDW